MKLRTAALLVLTLAAACQAAAQTGLAPEQYDERSLAHGGIVQFQRGVFRIEANGSDVQVLCIPVQGVWRYVGTQRDCGNPPPANLQRELSPFPNDVTFLGVRNLGISNEQWESAQASAKSGPPRNALRKVGEAFWYRIGNEDVQWRFESAKLPSEIKADIPGSGIHVHFGRNFSDAKKPAPFAANGSLVVETRLALPVVVHTGKAHSGMTIGIELEVPTDSGGTVPLPLIVSLLNADPKPREVLRSDGRRVFASTYLGPGTKYLEAIENRQRSGAVPQLERFAFRIRPKHIQTLLADAKAKVSGKGEPDERQLDKIRVSSVTLRNESRLLDRGDVTIEVKVDYLRIQSER
jgi:hypothetical protein